MYRYNYRTIILVTSSVRIHDTSVTKERVVYSSMMSKYDIYNLEPITLSRKKDKNFIPKITITFLLVTSLSEYIRHNRKISAAFNFRCNTYDKKSEKCDVT